LFINKHFKRPFKTQNKRLLNAQNIVKASQ